jgi:hypothetical protein
MTVDNPKAPESGQTKSLTGLEAAQRILDFSRSLGLVGDLAVDDAMWLALQEHLGCSVAANYLKRYLSGEL